MKNQSLVISAAVAGLCVLAVVGIFFVTKQEKCRDFSEGRVVIYKAFEPSAPEVAINGHSFAVNVANTTLEQSRGLGGCEKIPERAGMYFPYEAKQTPSFWMKGMRIPIDIIWIADDKVVGMIEYVPVPSAKLDEELPRYRPSRPITAVLEINAGVAKQVGIAEGDSVRFTVDEK